ncbi:hypothetical protein [Sphingomonas agri]|uniref:hypothetical protein n=1 Tax=Sphingomonas agri TaxID=1813878 RepID=UPI00311E21DE
MPLVVNRLHGRLKRTLVAQLANEGEKEIGRGKAAEYARCRRERDFDFPNVREVLVLPRFQPLEELIIVGNFVGDNVGFEQGANVVEIVLLPFGSSLLVKAVMDALRNIQAAFLTLIIVERRHESREVAGSFSLLQNRYD